MVQFQSRMRFQFVGKTSISYEEITRFGSNLFPLSLPPALLVLKEVLDGRADFLRGGNTLTEYRDVMSSYVSFQFSAPKHVEGSFNQPHFSFCFTSLLHLFCI